MFNKGSHCFCSPGWHRQGIVSDDCLGFELFSLEAVLTGIVKCGKFMKPCVVSMTTLLFLMKWTLLSVLFISSLWRSVQPEYCLLFQIWAWPLLTVFLTGHCLLLFESWESRRFRKIMWGFLFYCAQVIVVSCTDVGSWVYRSIYC